MNLKVVGETLKVEETVDTMYMLPDPTGNYGSLTEINMSVKVELASISLPHLLPVYKALGRYLDVQSVEQQQEEAQTSQE